MKEILITAQALMVLLGMIIVVTIGSLISLFIVPVILLTVIYIVLQNKDKISELFKEEDSPSS